MVWDRSSDNLRFSDDARDAEFHRVVHSDSWIMEGVHHTPWTVESFRRADLIFILNPHVLLKDYRILRRFIRARTGVEKWNFKQSVRNMLKMIVKWNHGYNWTEVYAITDSYGSKRFEVKSKSEILAHIQQ